MIEPVASIVKRSARATRAPESVPQLLRSASVLQGGVFLGSRAANGLLAILQVFLVTRAVGPAEGGRFFLLWTAAWLLSVVVKFGADGILPRAVAEARLAGAETVSIGRVLGTGLLVGAAALPIVMALLGIPLSPLEVGLAVGLAGSWAANGVVAALLKAYGRADLSGIVANVIWPTGGALAPLVVILAGGDWVTIAWLTLLASVLSLIAAGAVAARGLGSRPLRDLIGGSSRDLPVERDEVGAALLTTLYEVVIWLPVLIGGLLDVGPTAAAGLFAASRVAGVFSWGYQAVLTVLVPRIAEALARRDAGAARRVLRNGALAGVVVTWPVCLVGILLADPLLGLIDASYDEWSEVLVLLILARAVDAATGPLGEALLVGRRTWADAAFVTVGVVLGAATAEALYEPPDPIAIGIGAAGGFVVINLLRLGYVGWLLRGGEIRLAWRPGRDVWRSSRFPGAAALCVGLLLAVISASAVPDGSGGVLMASASAAVTALGLLLVAVRLFGVGKALTSPVPVVGLVLVCVFALRPAALVMDPGQATTGLVALGFTWGDLTSTVGIGVLGFGAFGAAFLVVWGLWPRREAGAVPRSVESRIARATLGALAAGSVLWGALFLRIGGFDALADDPASLHLGQFSGGYGVFGYMLCLAAALLALWAWLRRPTPLLGRVLALAAVVSVAAAFALQTRGPLIASIAAAAVIVLLERSISLRRILALALVGVLLVLGFAYMRTVREHAQVRPLGEAIEATADTHPLAVLGAEFAEVENFVALKRLVPDGLPWLSGRSLANVPAAFVPRQLWADKPLPVDFALSRAVSGPERRAGTPFTLAGELYWNYGVAGVLVGMTLLGALGAAAWRALRSRASGGATVAAAATVGYSYLLLTRPLGPMLLTTVMALVAIVIVALPAGLLQSKSSASETP